MYSARWWVRLILGLVRLVCPQENFKASRLLQAKHEMLAQYESFWRAADAVRHESDLSSTKAKTALKCRNELTAFIFHEIRNPLNAMAGAVQMMQQGGKMPPDMRKWANVASNSTVRDGTGRFQPLSSTDPTHLLWLAFCVCCTVCPTQAMVEAVLNDVLLMSKMERGKVVLQKEPFRIRYTPAYKCTHSAPVYAKT